MAEAYKPRPKPDKPGPGYTWDEEWHDWLPPLAAADKDGLLGKVEGRDDPQAPASEPAKPASMMRRVSPRPQSNTPEMAFEAPITDQGQALSGWQGLTTTPDVNRQIRSAINTNPDVEQSLKQYPEFAQALAADASINPPTAPTPAQDRPLSFAPSSAPSGNTMAKAGLETGKGDPLPWRPATEGVTAEDMLAAGQPKEETISARGQALAPPPSVKILPSPSPRPAASPAQPAGDFQPPQATQGEMVTGPAASQPLSPAQQSLNWNNARRQNEAQAREEKLRHTRGPLERAPDDQQDQPPAPARTAAAPTGTPASSPADAAAAPKQAVEASSGDPMTRILALLEARIPANLNERLNNWEETRVLLNLVLQKAQESGGSITLG